MIFSEFAVSDNRERSLSTEMANKRQNKKAKRAAEAAERAEKVVEEVVNEYHTVREAGRKVAPPEVTQKQRRKVESKFGVFVPGGQVLAERTWKVMRRRWDTRRQRRLYPL